MATSDTGDTGDGGLTASVGSAPTSAPTPARKPPARKPPARNPPAAKPPLATTVLSPGLGPVGGVVLLLGGLAGVTWAVSGPRWTSAAVAATVAGIGLWLVNRAVVGRWFEGPWRHEVAAVTSVRSLFMAPVWWRRLGPTLGLVVAAGGGAWLAIATTAPLPVVTVILAVGVTTVAPLAVLTRIAASLHPLAAAAVGLALTLAGLVGLVAGQRVAVPLPLIGVVVAMAGLGLYKAGLAGLTTRPRAVPVTPDRVLAALSTVAALVFAVGVTAMAVAVRQPALLPGAVGSVLIFLSLTALAVTWPRHALAPLGRHTTAVVGILFLLASVFVNWSTGLGDLRAWGVTIAIAGFGWSIVKRGEGIALGVLVGLVVLWSLVDRVADDQLDPVPVGANGRIVAFGDSYMSGEGAPAYFPGTNQVGDERNECRRAPTAYPYRVAELLDMGLDFYACSGARARDLVGDGTTQRNPTAADGATPADPGPLPCDDPGDGQMPCGSDDVFGTRLQIDNLPDDTSSIRVALVSIGGNDVRFSQIASGCLLPGSCDELRELWLGNVETLGPSLVGTYQSIKDRLPGVPVIVVPYPLIIAEADCAADQLDPGEHQFIYEFLAVLNEQLRTSAAQAGVHYFEPGLFAFEGRQICDEPRDATATNFISLAPPGGGFFDRLNPQTWIHNSMHPKPSGHALTADRLAVFVQNVLDAAEQNPTQANPAPDPSGPFTIRGVRGARPLPVDPQHLLAAARDCGMAAPPDAFATRVLVFDEAQNGNRDPGTGTATGAGAGGGDALIAVPPVLLAEADPGMPVCLRRDDGRWRPEAPVERSIEDLDGSGAAGYGSGSGDGDGDGAEGGGAAVTLDEAVFVTGVRTAVDPRQLVLYATRSGDVRLMAIDLCSRRADCPSSFDHWARDQLTGTARQVAPAFVMAILGGWLLALASPLVMVKALARTAFGALGGLVTGRRPPSRRS